MSRSFVLLLLVSATSVLTGPAGPLHRFPRDGSLYLRDDRPSNINQLSTRDLEDLNSTNFDACACGYRNEEDRIVGGREAGKSEFPWRCALFYNDPDDGLTLFCGCSIISQEYVLTAAHCTNAMKGRQILVDIGDYDITTKNDTANQVLKVIKVIQHEGYNRYTHDLDLSLLKLETPMKFTRNISPVCLPWKFRNASFANATVVASGSGATKEGGKISPVLRTVDLPVLETTECRKYYGNDRITDNMICTYSPGKDTCQGDSGSSIDYKDLDSKQYAAIGVVSWGSGCAREDKPGVYAKVTKFLDWIEENATGASFCKP